MTRRLPEDALRSRVRDAADQCDLVELHQAVLAYYKATGREPPTETEEAAKPGVRERQAGENECGND